MEILIGKGIYVDKFYMLNPIKQKEVRLWRERIKLKFKDRRESVKR